MYKDKNLNISITGYLSDLNVLLKDTDWKNASALAKKEIFKSINAS